MNGSRTMRAAMVFLSVLIVCLTVWVYFPVLHHEFITFDDISYVTGNSHVKEGLSLDSIIWAFRSGDCGNWHPLTWLTHMLDWELYGDNPGGHHLTNLVLHCVNGVGIFIVLSAMTGRVWSSFVAALFFAVHPMHVESVAWVSERKDVLSGLFFVLVLHAYWRYTLCPNRRLRFFVVCCFFVMGLMAKPMLVTVPFVLLLLDVWPLQRWRFADVGKVHSGHRVLVREKIGVLTRSFRDPANAGLFLEKRVLFLFAGVSCIVTFIVQQHGGAVADFSLRPPSARIANACISYVLYLGKLLYPCRLSPFYPYAIEGFGLAAVGSLALLLLVPSAVVLALPRWRWPAVAWFWYVGMLAPVIGLVQVGGQAMADRYTYLPSIGVLLAVCFGLPGLVGRRWWRVGWALTAVGFMLFFAVRAHSYVSVWRDSRTLFLHALQVTSDNDVAHRNLACFYHNRGDVSTAIEHFRQALDIRPDSASLHAEMGIVLVEGDQRVAALKHLTKALELAPENSRALFGLGLLALRQEHWADAIDLLGRSIDLEPEDPKTRYLLASAYLKQGNWQRAEQELRIATGLKSKDLSVYNDLGYICLGSGRTAEAAELFRYAADLDPDDPGIRDNLGRSLLALGQAQDAEEAFEAAIALDPNLPDAYANLGGTRLVQGKYAAAREAYEEALRRHPDSAPVQHLLGVTLAEEGKIDEAIAMLQSALRLDSDYKPSKDLLEELRKRQKSMGRK